MGVAASGYIGHLEQWRFRAEVGRLDDLMACGAVDGALSASCWVTFFVRSGRFAPWIADFGRYPTANALRSSTTRRRIL